MANVTTPTVPADMIRAAIQEQARGNAHVWEMSSGICKLCGFVAQEVHAKKLLCVDTPNRPRKLSWDI